MNTFEIVRLIGEASADFLSSTETSLLTRMAFFGDKSGKNIKPGIDELIRHTKLSRAAILSNLSKLIKKGVLTVDISRKRGDHEPSCYEINIPILKEKRISVDQYYKNLKSQKNKKINKKSSQVVQEVDYLSSPVDRLLNKDILSQVVQELDLSSPGGRLLSSPGAGPLPYTPDIEPLLPNKYVELGSNSTSLFSTQKPKKNWGDKTQEIFRYWQKVLNHPMSKLDAKRRTKIVEALKAGYSVDDLKKAIEGVKKSSFHMGDNDRGKVYDGILVIFRNCEQIETFIGYFDSPMAPKNKNGATAQKKGFLEKNRDQLNALDKLHEELFPDNNFLSNQTK